MDRFLHRIIFTLCFLANLAISAQAAWYMPFSQYTVADGLPSDRILSLDQDTCGHIWMATDGGVARFDGYLFKSFGIDEYPTLRRNDLGHVRAYEDGMVLLGGAQGVLLRYNEAKDSFEDYAPSDFSSSYFKPIEGFSVLRGGRKVALTSGGFYLLDSLQKHFTNQFPLFEKFKDSYTLSFYEDAWGRYWISSFNTLCVIEKDGREVMRCDLAKGTSSMFSSKIIPISDSLLLVTCFSDVLCKFKISPGGEISAPEWVPMPFSNLNRVLCDSRGHFWYTTDGYGFWYSDGLPQAGTKFEKVLPTNNNADCIEKLYDIIESADGDIWLGTHSAGLWRLSPYKPRPVLSSKDFRLPLREATGFWEDDEGYLYVSSDGGSVFRVSPDLSQYVRIDEKKGIQNKNVLSLKKDSKGHLWMSTWGGGVLEYDPVAKTVRKERFAGLNSSLSCFLSVTPMSNGEVWVCTGGDGVYMRTVDGVWKRYLLQFFENEYDMWPFLAVEGKGGVRWIATSRSVWRVCGDYRKPLLPDISRMAEFNPLVVNDLAVDVDGGVFVSTSRGILHFSEDASVVDTLDFLPKENFSALLIKRDGKLSASSSGGIVSIDYAKRTFRTHNIHKRDVGSFRRCCSYEMRDGRILWGTRVGFIIQNSDEQSSGSVGHLQFADVQVGGLSSEESLPYMTMRNDGKICGMTLPYNLSKLSITVDLVDFSGGDFDIGYRLKGLSDEWATLPSDRKITYSYLPEGKYELVLKVMQNGSECRQLSLSVEVLPPWWYAWWFKMLVIMGVALLVGGGFYRRVRNLKLMQAELEVKVEERTQELDKKNVLIEEQNEQLKLALFDKDRIISIVAHDLKNPMFAIVGTLESWMRKESDLDAESRRGIISKVLDSSRVLQDEMGRLLEWARGRNGSDDLQLSDVDAASALRNVLSLLEGNVEKKHIDLKVDVRVEHCAWVDLRMFSTVLRNFISNAIKFTPEEGKITVSVWEKPKAIEVAIVDNGVGMSAEAVEKLRKYGYCDSSTGTNDEKGTGLGFRICVDYIKRLGGEFNISSESGKGTTINVVVPASERAVRKGAEESVDRVVCRMEESVDRDVMGGNLVVVVDDDELIRQNVMEMLSPYMDVKCAANGEEALTIISENEVDLVLSDVEMPVMDGIELSRRLAADKRTNAVPFLFLSARTERSDRLLGLLSGAIDYIPKPFSEGELLMKVNNILRIRQKQQEQLLQRYYSSDSAEEKTEKEEAKLNPFVEKLMSVVGEHYSDAEFSIESLASLMGMSQSTLSRRAKSMIGKTPVEVLNEYRLNRAKALLKENKDEYNIAEIAYLVGFSDPAYFSRKFKDFFGVLPSSIK